jgi:signal transduction histidine kinase
MHFELTDISTPCREALAQARALSADKKLDVTSESQSEPLPVYGDTEALRRLFLILIDNAVKYTSEGGSVRVRLWAEDDCMVASVADSGIGITEDDQRHIFDRFWRADKVRSRGMGGAGLGLSIAKWIIDRHNGTVHVASKPGQGSTFTVRIPIATGVRTKAGSCAELSLSVTGPLQIGWRLLIDDLYSN